MRWLVQAALRGQNRNGHRVLVGKSEGKKLLCRPRARWEDEFEILCRSYRVRMEGHGLD